jgi:hypothetical protein
MGLPPSCFFSSPFRDKSYRVFTDDLSSLGVISLSTLQPSKNTLVLAYKLPIISIPRLGLSKNKVSEKWFYHVSDVYKNFCAEQVTGRIENDASNSSSVVACAAITFLSSSSLATIGWYIQTHTDWREGFKKARRWDGLRRHDIHTNFQKVWFRHSKVDMGDTETDRQRGDLISLLIYFFKMRKVG